jgi:hypothetical protein
MGRHRVLNMMAVVSVSSRNARREYKMSFTSNRGRFVGLLYLLVSIPGFLALIYVPNKLIVQGNVTATASNIVASETLFRVGIACNLISQILFIWVAVVLYDLFKIVNRRHALVMAALIVISVPIALLNELNAIAALILVHGADFLSLFDQPQRNALAMLFLSLHTQGFVIAEIFWGLWLFPLGLLVYRSGFVPRFLGILLMFNCLSYVVNSLTSILAPQCAHIISQIMKPLGLGELIFMFWLLVMGVKPKQFEAEAA